MYTGSIPVGASQSVAPRGRDPRRSGPLGCGSGPIDPNVQPYPTGLNFGNYRNARLTVIKRLFAASDPGRFDLRVNRHVVRAAAGVQDRDTVRLRPATYTVEETPAGSTSLRDPLGSARSHRCIRLANRAIDWIVHSVGAGGLPGIPVHVR